MVGIRAIENGLSFDIEDWFHEIWRAGNVKATFFFLGWVAERCPQLVREVVSDGHEIASHGYGHELLYEMTPASFREDLRRSKGLLEEMTGTPILGYRAPGFSITPRSMWALDVLRDEGFLYDSSVFPISGHDRTPTSVCS